MPTLTRVPRHKLPTSRRKSFVLRKCVFDLRLLTAPAHLLSRAASWDVSKRGGLTTLTQERGVHLGGMKRLPQEGGDIPDTIVVDFVGFPINSRCTTPGLENSTGEASPRRCWCVWKLEAPVLEVGAQYRFLRGRQHWCGAPYSLSTLPQNVIDSLVFRDIVPHAFRISDSPHGCCAAE